MSRNQTITGLSLKVGALGESDRLLTIFSDTEGITRLAIPGARKPRSSLHATAPLNLLQLNVVGKSRLKRVTQLKILRGYGNLGRNIETLAAAQALTELIIILVSSNDPQTGMLQTVLMHLGRLDDLNKDNLDTTKALAITVQSCMHLLALAGYCIPIQFCCKTGLILNPPIGKWEWRCSFFPDEGFAIGDLPYARVQLNPSELALMQRLLKEQLPLRSDGDVMGPQKVWLKLLTILESWIEKHLEKKIQSLQMLREILITNSISSS